MEKLICLLLLISIEALSLELKYLGKQEFSASAKFDGQILGGLSHAQFKNGKIFTVTNDRGKYGGARILVFGYQLKNNNWNQVLKFEKSINIKPNDASKILDLEAFHIFKDDRWIFSSEGDLNHKPRVMPFLRFWDQSQKWTGDIVLPRDFIPEKIGLQTTGLQNNSAFEALAVSKDEKRMWVFSEVPLFQTHDSGVEVLEYDLENLKKAPNRLRYFRDLPVSSYSEFFRGVSDAISIAENKFLVLERYVLLSPNPLRQFGADLFLVEKQNNQFKKTKILTLSGELAGNWEGLSLIQESDSTSTLLILEDNNFDSKVTTKFLFYKLTLEAGKK